MTDPSAQPAAPPPTPPFQFRLRTLLLLCVVLGSSLAVFGARGIVICGLVVGLAICVRRSQSLWSRLGLAVMVICLTYLLIMTAVNTIRSPNRCAACLENVKQIAAGLQLYHRLNGHFPPAYATSKNGKPIHSWRAIIMPYKYPWSDGSLGVFCDGSPTQLYSMSEPWDGPWNKNHGSTGLDLVEYACGCDRHFMGNVSYLAVTGTNAAWAGDKPRTLADFSGEAASTIMVIEVRDSGIAWAEPKDLELEALGAAGGGSPGVKVAGGHDRSENFFFGDDYGQGVFAVMADGSVRFLRTAGLSNEDLHRLLQIGGCREGGIGSPVLAGEYTRRPNWPNIAALAVWLLSVGTLLIGAVRSRKRLATSPPPAC